MPPGSSLDGNFWSFGELGKEAPQEAGEYVATTASSEGWGAFGIEINASSGTTNGSSCAFEENDRPSLLTRFANSLYAVYIEVNLRKKTLKFSSMRGEEGRSRSRVEG